jgi:hypothetical protein
MPPQFPPVPNAQATLVPFALWPELGPMYPKAGLTGVLVIALAYFSLGVGVGALMRQSPNARRWLPFVVVPGILAGLVFFAWVVRSLL